MAKIKDILNRFEVSRVTLYNWSKNKPFLYDYLLKFDEKDNLKNTIREMSLVFEEFAKNELKSYFELKELRYIYKLDLPITKFEEIKDLDFIFINSVENTRENMNIYIKLVNLNIIERYILINRFKYIKNSNIEDKDKLFQTYLKEFINIL